ncbi:MAG: SulP family inorganic anion transporter [Parachlamydiales bacterium]|nr:SulP family inorganic anion transporter [Parachlamydiales bacterium]
MKKTRFWPKISLIPFWKELKTYEYRFFKKDIFSSLSIAFVTIPQAIAYSLIAGLPVSAGLYSAIFGSIFTGVFGASRYLVAGPTTGVAILIQVTISDTLASFYPDVIGRAREELSLALLMHLVIFMGMFQIIFGLLHMGKALRFVSRSVILGYFSGVMITVVINQLYYFSGVPLEPGYHVALGKAGYFLTHVYQVHLLEISVGVVSVLFLYFLRKSQRKWPASFLMLVMITLLTYTVFSLFPEVCHKPGICISNLKNMGYSSFSSFSFAFPWVKGEIFDKIWPYALTISFVAILEVFSISRTISGKTGERESSSQGIFALGISNLFLSCVPGSMPASGSVSRSFLNLQLKAKTRFSGIGSGLLVALMIFFFWPMVQHVPAASLAALILFLIPKILDFSQIRLCFTATKSDAVVFMMTMGSCLIFSLDIAFFLGILFSIVFFLKRASEPHLVEFSFNAEGKLVIIPSSKREKASIRILGIGGDLFFGVVDIFQKAVQKIASDPHVQVIVLRLNGVYHMDASMCIAIDNFYKYLRETKRHLVLCGISEEVWSVLGKSGLMDHIGKDHFFLSNETRPQVSTWQACLKAEELANNF